MKRGIILAVAAAFLLAGCAGSGDANIPDAAQSVSETPFVSEDTMEQGTGYTQTTQESALLQIEVNGQLLTATLEDNSSAQALVDLIGDDTLTLDLEDYSNFEKVGDLPERLPTNDEQIDTDAGDIILYQGRRFVLYYDKNSWDFTKLGHVNNISKDELQELLGEGDVTVTLSIL